MRLKRPLVAIDLETTGTDVKSDRIVQIAIVRMDVDGSRTVRSRCLNPGRHIPEGAQAVHGIGDADVRECPSFRRVASSLYSMLSGANITGYNAKAFDVPVLEAEFARAGIRWPEQGVRIIDSFRIFRRMEPQTLSKALEYYTGEILSDAHDAEADAHAALDVLIGQGIRYEAFEQPGRPIDESGELDLDALADLERDPDWIDSDGKMRWDGDVAVMNFGKWSGRPVSQVDASYFDWASRQDFGDEFKKLCLDAKNGIYPAKG